MYFMVDFFFLILANEKFRALVLDVSFLKLFGNSHVIGTSVFNVSFLKLVGNYCISR